MPVPRMWSGSNITVTQSLQRHVHVLTVLIGALLYSEWFSLYSVPFQILWKCVVSRQTCADC